MSHFDRFSTKLQIHTAERRRSSVRPSEIWLARVLPKVGEVGTEPESPKVEKDKTRILNAITGAEFDGTPDLKHPAFGRVNNFLRGQIIANGHQQLVAAGQMGEMIDCVCADSGRTTLALVLREQEELRDLAPVGAVGNLQALTSLHLLFAGCSNLSRKLRTTFDSKAAFLAALEALEGQEGLEGSDGSDGSWGSEESMEW